MNRRGRIGRPRLFFLYFIRRAARQIFLPTGKTRFVVTTDAIIITGLLQAARPVGSVDNLNLERVW